MKIVVIGGSGLIGRNLIAKLQEAGHDAVSASPSTGVDTLTGTGLAEILQGAQVAVDVTNSPSFEAEAVRAFFETSTRNLLDAEAKAGVGHHIALSIVHAEEAEYGGYLVAKIEQERLIASGRVPYTIVRATQFYEFISAVADASKQGETIHAPDAHFQPIAAADVVTALASVAVASPVNGVVDIAGPECSTMGDFIARVLAAKGDSTQVITDAAALYFGTKLERDSIVPTGNARLGAITLDHWLRGEGRLH